MEGKKRITLFDNIKGILIILVVFGHTLYNFIDSPLISVVVQTIYVFHMPAFVFISGYFSKSEHSKSGESLLKLMSAYVIFNTALMIYSFSADKTNFQLLYPYNSCWYLISLVVWRFLSRYIPINKKTLILSIVVALAIGFFPDVDNVLAASRTAAFYPFFIMGMTANNKRTSDFCKNKKACHYLFGFFLILLSVILSLFFMRQFGNVTQDDLQMFAYTLPTDVLKRLCIFLISTIFIAALFLCAPKRKIFFITKAGQASLSIYLLHRIPTLLCADIVGSFNREEYVILAGLLETVLLTAICSLNVVSAAVNKITDSFLAVIKGRSIGKYTNIVRIISAVLAVFISIIPIINMIISSSKVSVETASAKQNNQKSSSSIIYKQISDTQLDRINNSTKILFTGNLVLSEDRIKQGYKNGKYNFDSIFGYAKKYISDADISICSLEGTTAGKTAGYSADNLDGEKNAVLNYPDEFADAVKSAGFDFVATANDHFLDNGIDGAIRTLDVLDRLKLDHTGTYRNAEEKNKVKIIEKNGIKIAVLSYACGSNNFAEDCLLSDKYSYLTSLTADPKGKNFEEAKKRVVNDFKNAKKLSPDIILVLPNMGEKVTEIPDEYQKTWNDIFISLGADIILNCHANSVQPLQISEHNGKTQVIVNCTGNFTDTNRKNFGDASAMAEIYIDNKTKKPHCASVIPMQTESMPDGNYRTAPTYELLNGEQAKSQISSYDSERTDEVQRHITKIMLGNEISSDLTKERYYLTPNGLYLPRCEQIKISDEIKNTVLYKKITSAKSVCYVGDSVTEGTKNGGYGWYRPIEKLNPHTYQCAKGGTTTKQFLTKPSADYSLYIVAIGTNDVRYRNKKTCAMTKEEYIYQLESFTERILKENPDACFCFIAPWFALENDPVCRNNIEKRDELFKEYTLALKEMCKKNGYIFSDPNGYIKDFLKKHTASDYMVDHIHPNCTLGIDLYAESVLKYSEQ